MKMADRTLDLGSLLPSSYEYAFIDEPNILKVYAQYKKHRPARTASSSWY